jgi:NAD(P)-dependent dehydrogenase (short-subunit alcohol dehydrogenase family)
VRGIRVNAVAPGVVETDMSNFTKTDSGREIVHAGAKQFEAFNTLFNKRDYDAASRFWSDKYTQHSAHIEPGRDGLFRLIQQPALRARPHSG